MSSPQLLTTIKSLLNQLLLSDLELKQKIQILNKAIQASLKADSEGEEE